MNDLVTVTEAKKMLGVTSQCVFDLIRRGKLGEAKHFQSPNPKQRMTMVTRKAVEERIRNRKDIKIRKNP